MPDYTVAIEDVAYTLVAEMDSYLGLKYELRLNGVGACTIPLASNDDKLSDLDLYASGAERIRRVRVLRNGLDVYGGLLERLEWKIPEDAPANERWQAIGGDHGLYLGWRVIVPGVGQATYDVTDHADDAIKNLVKYHAGASASTGRPFTDLTVAADANAAPSYEVHERFTPLLDVVQTVASGIWCTGAWCQRQAARPSPRAILFGLDRTRGNVGGNAECIFSLDARNFLSVSWVKDRTGRFNYAYVGGDGTGATRTVVERSNGTDITNVLRRERFVNAGQSTTTAALQAAGDAAIAAAQLSESMDCMPISTQWKAATGTTWDLGDKVTVDIYPDGGREFTMSAVITGIDVEIGDNGVEIATPILKGG